MNLRGGVESISRFDESTLDVSTLDAIATGDPAHVKAGGILDGIELFDAAFFGITPREAQITDPQHRLFLECAWEAIESAGYDAAAYTGAIGVYASAGSNTYLLNNLCSNPDVLAAVGSLQIAIGNEKDYLATRTSYKLDLRGPSMSVQSACSSSLLAVHVACQALLNGECDMALAGGVSIAVPQKTGYRYHQGGIGSPDGHCRAFDAQAQGTVKGNGVGVVLLKRLVDAIDDGDTIVAVIKGSATNNDGSGKVSYTAPSGVGQADVIAAAQTIAGVDSAAIGFVEAHGTGTALGDPIEIAALTTAFGAQGIGDERCLVGSMKSNVGHLDAAAGIAGLLKAALVVKHGQIPATVHYTRANPNIDFETSPFAVNAAIARWPKRDGPRRAGVSSFGIGGTNVHLILEEAPVAPSGAAPSGDQLVLLSARTPAALDAMSDRLAAHLVAEPDLCLADVAYTLQVGRKAFDHRRALVGSTSAEIATALATRPARRVHTASKSAAPRPVAFLFPGQGAQHVRMAAGLYADEPRFAAPFRACAEMLAPHLGVNLCDVLYGGGGADEDAAVALRRTALAQPALFAVDYALAHLWSEWGVEPRAMIGHSVGEYVAACRAGVFALEDALALVAFRGTLMQQCPEGSMLAVPLPEEEVRAVLDADCSLAAVNRRSLCVVSGPNAAIDGLARRLAVLDIAARRLDVSHAFHSPMMDPILDTFVAVVDKITLRAPSVPFLSNVSGTWITDDEATDPRYWARQLRRPVQFAASVETLLAEGDWVFLEVGPGAALGNAVRSFIADRPGCVVSSSLPVAGTDRSDLSCLRDAAGRLWCHGVDIRRDRLSSEPRRRVPLPTYPFERRRHWIDARAPAKSGVPAVAFDEADEVDAPAPSDISDLPATASLSDKEAVVAALWRDVLGVDVIDASSNFFELGGDSIAGLQMTFQARQRGLHVGLAQLLDHPTVAALAAVAVRLTQAVADDGPPGGDGALPVIVARPADRGEPFPLTAVQQAYWIGRSGAKELGSVAAHVYQEYQSADLDLGRLERALDVLIRRHEALRSVTTADGRQRILMDVPHYRIAIHDLQGASVETLETERAALRERMSHQVLPSERWPLFEVVASRSDDDFRLHLSIDILFTDAWSLVLLGRELLDLYRDPTRVLASLDLSFRDYVLAEIAMRDGNLYQQSRRYWMARLDGLPPAPALPPAARDRAAGTPRFVRRSGRLDADRWTAIKRHGGRIGLTPSTVLCAAYAEILAVWSASPRFCLNLPLFNRLPLHSDVNRILGDFTSVVLLEVDVGDDDSFEQHALRLQSRLWSDLDHRHFSGVDVIRELGRLDASRAQMPIVFTSLILPGAQDRSADAVATLGEAIFSISQTPQVHLDHQVAEDGDGLVFNWDAVDEAFPPGLVADMFDAYSQFLCALASDDAAAWRGSARRRVSLPAAQIEAWAAFNATEGARSSALLHTGFFRQANDAPGRVALITPTRSLRYGELASCSWRIAQRLRDLGGGRGMLVAVVMDKGWEQIAAVLATLLVEGVYVPIDASFPTDYLHQVLAEARVGMILTQPWLDMTLVWPNTIPRLALRDDDLVDDTMRSEHPPIATPGSPEDLAYIIYTSGTTGTPKGVMIDHRGAVNTILDVNARFGIGPDDRVFALSALNFDLSVYDLFGTLATGAALVLPAATGIRDPVHWAQMMRQAGVTVWNSVPALMEMLVHALDGREADALTRLGLVLLSGDWIPVRLPERIAALAPNARLVSLGGATEASIWSILYDITTVDPAWTSIPYGRPMLNQRILVLDDTFEPRPIHVPGALFIGGAGLAKGYWRNADETDARFVRHPVTGERLYRTGDLGRLLPDGTIEFLGREDFQVKIQGYRIELGEIEAALCRHPAVEAAAVVAGTTPGGGKRLIAYVVVRHGQSVAAAVLREATRERLPDYMVPSLVVTLDALPMTPNGKIDRRALPAPHEEAPIDVLVAPQTATERRLSTIWCQILDQSAVGIDRNFFEIGGDSLLATKMMVAIQGAFDQEVPLRTIFDLATVEALAAHLDRLVDPSDTIRPIARVGRDRPLPVSASQGRLWFNDRLDPGNATYNFPVALRLTGPLRVDILERCLEEIVRRHEVLRTAFAVVDGIPVQIVAAEQPVCVVQDHVERFDVQGQATAIRSALAEESLFAFDLTRGPMFRARLIVLSDEARVLIMTMHHIITDAWSMAILVDEIASLYEAFGEGRPSPLAPLPIQYADYAAWERETVDGGALRSQAAHWKTVLDGPIPRLSLPEDHPESTAVPNNGARVAFVIEEGTLTGLRALCRDEGITLFMVLMASWQLLLYAYSREPDIRVGTPTANRDQPDVERLIGVFVNTLVLQTHVEPTARVDDILRQVRESALGAFANQRLPFDKVVEDYWRDRRGVERTPLFRTWFVLQNVPIATPRLGNILVTPMDAHSLMAVHPLKLSIVEQADALECAIDFRTHLFEATTIERMRELFEHLLDMIVADPMVHVEVLADRLSNCEAGLREADDRDHAHAREAALGRTRRRQIPSSLPSG